MCIRLQSVLNVHTSTHSTHHTYDILCIHRHTLEWIVYDLKIALLPVSIKSGCQCGAHKTRWALVGMVTMAAWWRPSRWILRVWESIHELLFGTIKTSTAICFVWLFSSSYIHIYFNFPNRIGRRRHQCRLHIPIWHLAMRQKRVSEQSVHFVSIPRMHTNLLAIVIATRICFFFVSLHLFEFDK